MGHGPYYKLFLKISLIFILNFQIILKVVKFLHLLTQKTKKRKGIRDLVVILNFPPRPSVIRSDGYGAVALAPVIYAI
jgi:hypothetical protein